MTFQRYLVNMINQPSRCLDTVAGLVEIQVEVYSKDVFSRAAPLPHSLPPSLCTHTK